MLEGEGCALDIISWSMSEEAVLLPVSKDNSLQSPSITPKVKSGEVTRKAKRKQEYTDIVNSLLQQPTSTTPKK